MCTYSQVTQAHWQTHTQAKSLTNMRDTVGAPVSFLPGSGRLRSTGTQYLLGAQVSWLRQVRVTLVAARFFAFCFCVYLCVCLSLLPPQPHNMNLDQFM